MAMPEVHSEEDRRIGAAMRAARERCGVSGACVAARAGYRVEVIDALEGGHDCWSVEHLRNLARAYGVGVAEAFVIGGLLDADDLRAWRPGS